MEVPAGREGPKGRRTLTGNFKRGGGGGADKVGVGDILSKNTSMTSKIV